MRRALPAMAATVLFVAGCGGGDSSTTSTPSSTSADTTSSADVTSTSGTGTTSLKPINTKKLKQQLSTPASPDVLVKAALTTRTPELACSVYTDALLKSAYGSVQGCVAAIKAGGSAKSVKIVSSKTSGSTATVVAVPTGGPSSGEKLTYSLVMENGQWRLDKVKSNVKVGP